MDLYLLCLEQGIPMVGVCRGAQFLHVMNGGKLFQHVDGHFGDHGMFDIVRKQRVERISSVHHQMVMPNLANGMTIIGTSAESQERWTNDGHSFIGKHCDIEAFFYRESCCFGVQGHPEYEGYNFFTHWFLKTIEEVITCNPDLFWDGPNLRLRPEILAERQKIIITTSNKKGN
jgi:gamma-glutamyl-gamma-aminobutyrate hydrolase PuuD